MARELTLFDDIERTDHRPSTRARTSFDFLNTSAWPAYHNMRDTLEQWFERYPDSSKTTFMHGSGNATITTGPPSSNSFCTKSSAD